MTTHHHGLDELECSDIDVTTSDLVHRGNMPSIDLTSPKSQSGGTTMPWSPTSLSRAKTAIVYKFTLNDSLMIRESGLWSIFKEWKTYFVSLQGQFLVIFETREDWEQGSEPNKVIHLNHMMMLSEMQVDTSDSFSDDGSGNMEKVVHRLFRRKLIEFDQFDDWLNSELNIKSQRKSAFDEISTANQSSSRCVLEFASYNSTTFELWSKTLRKTLHRQKRAHKKNVAKGQIRISSLEGERKRRAGLEPQITKEWVTPGGDCKVSMLKSEIWCNRVLADDRKKAESELRRLVAMESLVSQISSDSIALLVYQKVSRINEMFVANSRREMEGLVYRESPMEPQVLAFFANHLKRKYSAFLSLALSSNVLEEDIRDAHEVMCAENRARYTGIGGGGEESGETLVSSSCEYGFDNAECLELYAKYRVAAASYFEMNYGDENAAEEEDAIMHLPVTLSVALLQGQEDEAELLCDILTNVKNRLENYCRSQEINGDDRSPHDKSTDKSD